MFRVLQGEYIYIYIYIALYNVYVKCLDKLDEWVLHTQTRQKVYQYTCTTTRVDLIYLISVCGDTLKKTLKFQLQLIVLSVHYNEVTFHQRSFYTWQTISSLPGTLERTWHTMIRHVRAWIGWDGGNFGHLLWFVIDKQWELNSCY